jgi:hypothetical protein
MADHLYRDVGFFLDVSQRIMLPAVVFLLWKYVQALRHVETIDRFWVKHRNDPKGTASKLVGDPLWRPANTRKEGRAYLNPSSEEALKCTYGHWTDPSADW